jgi:hypothetical protein
LQKIRTFRSRYMTEDDVSEVEGLPCTTAARTIRDLSWSLTVNPLRDMAIVGMQKGLLDLDDLVAQAGNLGTGVAGRRFNAVLGQLGRGAVDSPFEWEVRQGLEGRGLAPWPTPFPWRCQDGVTVRIDIAFPWAWLAIECDGKGKYLLGADFTTDRIRWSEVGREWQLMWLDWTRWSRDPEAVLDDIEQRLAVADRTRAPAQPAV